MWRLDQNFGSGDRGADGAPPEDSTRSASSPCLLWILNVEFGFVVRQELVWCPLPYFKLLQLHLSSKVGVLLQLQLFSLRFLSLFLAFLATLLSTINQSFAL